MITFDDSFRLLSYACAPLLTIAAFVALKQLEISRSIARMQAKRDSLSLAGLQCRYFMDTVIPSINVLDNLTREHRKAIESICTCEVTANGYSVQFEKGKTKPTWKDTNGDFVKVFNSFESFATYFTSGAAHEGVAFNSVGTTYCYVVRSYLPNLALLGAGDAHYKNLIMLFCMWQSRLDKMQLEKEKEDLEKKLYTMKSKTIKPEGT